MKPLLFALVILFTGLGAGLAHEVRPAYLELRQTKADTYTVLWKVPGLGEELRLGLYVHMPADSIALTEPHGTFINNAFIERWSVKREGGLAGARIGILGLDATLIDALVRVERLDGSAQVTRLTPAMSSFVVETSPSAMEVATTYLKLGVEHILLGYDHLLFLLVLIMIVGSARRIVATVTAFTVAHSITLALAALAVVRIPQPPVEAAIALSIVFVASEVIRLGRGDATLTVRFPWIVAFVFGLLHGFGFAGALLEIGLPKSDVPVALFTFNLGVECGQLLFIGAIFAMVGFSRMLRIPRMAIQFARPAATYVVGATATFWFLERLATFGL